MRTRLHGKTTYYNWNLHLNSTNVCEADCLFCSFSRLKTGEPKAYTMSIEDAEKWIRNRYKPGMTEIHIVNGRNPNLDFEYYPNLLRMIRRDFPELHIKAFTAVEIHYFAQKYAMSYEAVLKRLVEAGLGSLPGGGADIFADRVRKKICRDNVKAYWVMLGVKTAQTALLCGANDIDGTVTEEKIYHMAGSHSPDALTLGDIRHLITAAGLEPQQERNTTYQLVSRDVAA